MDTSCDNCIYVHRSDGSTIRFEPSHRGVYKHEITSTSINNLWDFTLINTVAECAEKYTPQELTRAKEARRLQNIIMRPGSRYFKDMAIQHLHGCPITSRDVTIADNVYGPNLGSLKGKTTRRPVPSVSNRNDPVPPPILATHNHLGLSTDIFFINKMTFLSTYSRDLRFRTVVTLANRQLPNVRDHLQATLRLYHSRGFRISAIYADPEFEGLRHWFPQLETCGADDHIGDVERSIRTIKDRVRSTYRMLPFRQIPRIILGHLVHNAVFWLNSFPSGTGPTTHHSPAYLMTGRQVTYKAHAQLEFGEYVQTHEEHSNDMRERTAGAICLGPTGNAQGTHFFMSLATGSLIRRTRWTRLPMPIEVIHRVNQLGRAQNMPQNLAFGDRHGLEIGDDLDDIVDDPNDDDFIPLDPDTADDTLFYDDDLSAEELGHPEFPDDPSFTDLHSVSSHDDDSVVSDPETTGVRMETDDESCDGDNYIDKDSDNPNSTESTGVEDTRSCENTGVEDTRSSENTGVEETRSIEDTGVEDTRSVDDESSGVDDKPSNMCDEIRSAEEAGRIAAINDEQLPKRMRKPYNKHMNMMNMVADYIHTTFEDMEPEVIFTLLAGKDMQSQLTLLTTQMSAKAGLKQFGQAGADAIMKELEQLLYRKVMQGKRANTLTRDQKKAALHYLMFLKQKRCGKIKARGCADGRKQRLYKTKEETSSPTVSIEGLFLTCIIDVLEKRDVATVDIPGAFMQADIDELIHVKLEGETAVLLVRIDPTYQQFLTYENGKPVIYAELTKALYGTVQAAMLFWKNLTNFLVNELGFMINPYDFCVANKNIDGKQCTIAWHVDDLKISHASSKVVDSIIDSLGDRYGKETPLSVTRGKVHEYLGMTIDFSNTEFVQFYMHDFVNGIIEETPAELLKGIPTTPAANHLFDIDDNAEKLDSQQAITFHHLVAKLLYLCKRARPDLQLAVAFLTTRVQSPDVDDWKKLGRCLTYLRETKDEKLTLGADDLGVIKWWIDASFAVHKDYKSHTGATMSLGRGHPISMSSKQKINTRSSTEAELVGVNDAMSLVLWVRMFLLEQGFEVKDNVIFQDNQSTILLARNGRQSSGKKTRHIEIRYYFITDNISRGTCSVKYCPTEQMIADFFTKPLQGSLFRWMRDKILGKHHIGVTDSQECVGAGASMPTTNEDLGDVDVTHALMVEDEGFFRLDEEKESAQQVKEKEFSHTHQCRSYSDVVKTSFGPHPILSSQFETLKISWALKCPQHILVVELYNPRKRNAISSKMWREIGHLFSNVIGQLDDDIRVIILKGYGHQAFTAGIDLGDASLFPTTTTTKSDEETVDIARRGISFAPQIRVMQQCFTAIEQCAIPVIAAMEGSCIGAGLDLCCACDIRLCAANTRFSVREVQIGLAADIGTLQRLPKITGNDSRVRELCYTGESFDASDALRIGVVSRISENLMQDALCLAQTIATNSPVAVTGTKRSLVYSRDRTVAEGLDHVAMHNALALMTDDIPEAVSAAKQKSKPQFQRIPKYSKL
ncbi:enoyl-CoA hydratase [Nitzschia inconspicua]|uniref:Enoyl-CoA hydratase n=1 Tax=Nitzschia inconspicua TaxID=303405 RepID=A0A9K3PQL8_9STRA|nr:enoyl-CoA hydratase [Nitzschia inconspicua]